MSKVICLFLLRPILLYLLLKHKLHRASERSNCFYVSFVTQRYNNKQQIPHNAAKLLTSCLNPREGAYTCTEMLYWMGIECWSVARTYCLGPPKLLVSASELELKFPIPKHICRSLNCASLHSEVDNTLLTGVTNQKRILGYGGNSFIIHLNASALFTPWVISIYYESRVKLCSAGYFFFFFSLSFIAGKLKRGCNCFYFHIPVIMIIFHIL